MARVVVVGAGPAGLAAAARLATRGHDVVVVDAGRLPGGRTAPWPGLGLPLWCEPVTLPAALHELFNKTGRPLAESLTLTGTEPARRLVLPDGTSLDLPGIGPARTAESLGDALGGRAAEQWRGYLTAASAAWQLLREPLLNRPGTDPTRLPGRLPGRGCSATAHRLLPDPRLASLLELAVVQTGFDPAVAPSWWVVLPYLASVLGAWDVAEGPTGLATALAGRATARGARLVPGVRARLLLDPDDQVRPVRGVVLHDGTRLAADLVVLDADPATVLPDPDPDAAAPRTPGVIPRVQETFVVLGVEAAPTVPWTRLSLVPHDLTAALDAPLAPGEPLLDVTRHPVGTPGADPATTPSATTAPGTPAPGTETWVVRIPWRAPAPGPDRARTALPPDPAAAVLARLREAGVLQPSSVRTTSTIDHRTVADRLCRPDPAPGPAPDLLGRLRRRPLPAPLPTAGPLPGVFTVGSAALPGPTVALAVHSAELVADLVGRA